MDGIKDGIRSMSLGDLFTKLHNAIRTFVGDLDVVISRNSEASTEEIYDLRAHITERLREGRDPVENEKLLKLLNLLLTDKTVIELMREDANEWMGFLDAISKHIENGTYRATDEEKKELEEMRGITAQISGLIRK